MSTASDEMFGIVDRLEEVRAKADVSAVKEPLDALEGAADQIGKAWSGSFIGYHSRVYHQGLTPPPPGAHFSSEWGFKEVFSNDTRGGWEEYGFDSVQRVIREAAGDPDLQAAEDLTKEAREVFEDSREEVFSILAVMLEGRDDDVIARLREEAKNLELFGANDFIQAMLPNQYMSRDNLAMSQGLQVPPHLDLLADVFAARSPTERCGELAKIVKRAASHSARRERRADGRGKGSGVAGKKVFIGHGRSLAWRELKDFIRDKLKLDHEEFDRVSVAGVATTERLSQMLDDSAMAFLVMTAEDEQRDGKMNARLNVVHEAGLFQGRFGFQKAIVLLEEGCEEFSNIHGLGQIRFPAGDISARFEKIREVLEREGLITP